MMPEKNFNLDQELCFQLYVASKEIIRLYKPHLDELSLTYTAFITLRSITDGMSVTELGKQLFLDSGTLSPLLKKLETRGLIKRTRSRKDERILRVHLTEKGYALQTELPNISRKVFHDIHERNPQIPYEDLLKNLQSLNSIF